MIPANAFLIGQAPAAARIPNYTLPFQVILSYREGAQIFSPVPQVPPFTVVARILGNFEATIEAGEQGFGFGARANLIRSGVYGAILIDRINADMEVITPLVEHCPDVTLSDDETSYATIVSDYEVCPPARPFVDDVRVTVVTTPDA